VTGRLRAEAEKIQPAPASLVVFGSFVRGEARDDSDIDVLAVPPRGEHGASNLWAMNLAVWCDEAARVAGNPVNLLEVTGEELPKLVVSGSLVWREIVEDGVVLAGVHPSELTSIR
jgi:predicted nucleotidyltransferase